MMNVLCLITTPLPPNTSLFTVHEKFDTLGRNQGYALSNNVGLITGTMQSFDQYGRLNQVAIDGISGAFTYGYLEGTHLQKTLAMPNGVTRTFGYEANRDLLKMIIHSNATERLVQRDFTFDGFGRLIDRTLVRASGSSSSAPDAFGYNNRSELTNAIIGANTFGYNFDPIGNRLASTEFGTNTSYIASAINQYTSISNSVNSVPLCEMNPEFDLDGNQTLLKTTTGIWQVTYNAENRPVLFSNATTVVSMAYDYMGRRFEYIETVNNTLTRHERYLYRGYLQIAALNMLNSASVNHTIVWDASERVATRPLVLQIGTAAYYYSFDQIKNVTELFDGSGALAATYDYSPFGQITSALSVGSSMFDVASNPMTFSSEIHDSTLGLQYYNYRHLNTLDGRWVNRDPIGERGGANVYGVVYNNAFNEWDSLGLSATDVFKSKEIHEDKIDLTFNVSESLNPPDSVGGIDIVIKRKATGAIVSKAATVEMSCDPGCGTIKLNIPGPKKYPDIQCGNHLNLKKVTLVIEVWAPRGGGTGGHELYHAADYITQFNDTAKKAQEAVGHCCSKKKCDCLKSLYEKEMPEYEFARAKTKTHLKDAGEKDYEERHKEFEEEETKAKTAYDTKIKECYDLEFKD